MEREYEVLVDWQPYDKETIEAMYNFRIYGMPVSFLLLDCRKTDTYCHLCASLLSMVIPGSVRKEGKLGVLDGDYHSWVEINDWCYDTSFGAMWRKVPYQGKRQILDEKIVDDDGDFKMARKFNVSEGCNELYVAWIREFEEVGLQKSPYRVFLREHIERFKEEKGVDRVPLDEKRVVEYMEGLQEMYVEIEEFKSDAKISVK